MNETESNNTKSDEKINLTRRFVVSGWISVILIVMFATFRGYYSLRGHAVKNISDVVAQRINDVSNRVISTVSSNQKTEGLADAAVLNKLGLTLMRIRNIKTVDIFSLDKSRLWSSSGLESSVLLSKADGQAFNEILENPSIRKVVIDESFL